MATLLSGLRNDWIRNPTIYWDKTLSTDTIPVQRSRKDVAPALIGERLSYENMTIGDGGAVGIAFQEMIAADTTPKRKKELREAILAYCKQDTLAMVELVDWLFEQI